MNSSHRTGLLSTFQFITLLSLVSLGAAQSPKLDQGDSVSIRLHEVLAEAESEGFSGAVLVAQNDAILFERGYGFANRERKTPITSQTVFTVGSVSKQFTAAATLRLMEREKLALTQTLGTFFPTVPEDKRKITVHQLLVHSSGLTDLEGSDFDVLPMNTFFDRLWASELLFTPGDRHHYSNAGYSVLARIIELVSGLDYEALLFQELWKPLGMQDTGYLRPDWDRELLAHGYHRAETHVGTMIERYSKAGAVSWMLKGNGGIHSTQADMLRWMTGLESGAVLSAPSMKLLTAPHIAEQESGTSHYGYGWALFRSSRGTNIISHNGGNGIFFFDLLWLREESTLILFATNTYRPEFELAWQLEKVLFPGE